MGQSPAERNPSPQEGRIRRSRRLHSRLPNQEFLDFLAPWVPASVDLQRLSAPQLKEMAFRGFASLLGDDLSLAEAFAWQLQRCFPGHPETDFAWASIHLLQGRPALARKLFLEIPEEHKLGKAARESARDISRQGDPDWDCRAGSEEAQFHLGRGALARAEECAREVLRRWPEDVGARNDLATILFHAGQRQEAIELARQVVQSQPEHYSALANLFSFLYLSGRFEEARPLAERLQRWQGPIHPQKAAECAALQGDDRAVLEVFRKAQEDGWESALLYHLAAVAKARKGEWRVAIDHWQTALELNPNLDLAEENLLNAGKSKSRRHSAWYFPLEMWVSKHQLEAQEDLHYLVEALLDRGDPQGCELAVGLLLRDEDRGHRKEAERFLRLQRGNAALRAVVGDWLSR